MNENEPVQLHTPRLPFLNVAATDFHFLHAVALECARRVGVPHTLLEDCAQEFVLHILTTCPHTHQENEPLRLPFAWLRRNAHNHAIDFLRHAVCVYSHEATMPEEETDAGHSFIQTETPETSLLEWEFLQRIMNVVACLTPSQQDLFNRLIVNEDSASEVSQAIGRTAPAIRQARCNLCRQLRVLFQRRNITEVDLREYISCIQNYNWRCKYNYKLYIILMTVGYIVFLKSPLMFKQMKMFRRISVLSSTDCTAL